MIVLNSDGLCVSLKISIDRKRQIERRPLVVIRGIIVHQTDSPTVASTLNSYDNAKANGAHFLITEHGKIIQTASLLYQTMHVGKLRARCVAEKRCREARLNVAMVDWGERRKEVPDRYPSNEDSIGIEIVGQAFPRNPPKGTDGVYQKVSDDQNSALKWLVGELLSTFDVPASEIFPHSTVSKKNVTEATTAKW